MAKYTHKTGIYSTGTFFFLRADRSPADKTPADRRPANETSTQHPSSTTKGQYRIRTEA
jgi:hypothetical protein